MGQKTVFVEGNTLRVVDDYEAPKRDEESLGVYKREEQIDGVVYSMSAAPYARHAMIVSNIEHAIARQLKRPCRVFSEGLEFHYKHDVENAGKKGDQLQPDVMIACEMSKMLGRGYYGQCNFIVEVASPSTMKYDKTEKFRCYESSGVSEYWIVNPSGAIDIYYLVDGHYELQQSWIIQDEYEEYDDYNAHEKLTLREFPDISMTLEQIFE